MKRALGVALLSVLSYASVIAMTTGSTDIASFVSAKPVWVEGREREMNVSVGFRATVDGQNADKAVVRLTGATICRLFVNGEFLGYGPARGPHGFFRVDEWPLTGHCKPGPNVIAIEVAGYNANSYNFINQPSFLQAKSSQVKPYSPPLLVRVCPLRRRHSTVAFKKRSVIVFSGPFRNSTV